MTLADGDGDVSRRKETEQAASFSTMEDDQLEVIQRHFIWAHRFRRLYYDKQGASDHPMAPMAMDRAWFAGEAGMFLTYWYVNLFEIAEMLSAAGVVIDEIQDALVDHYHALRRLRNAVSHPAHTSRWDDRLFAALYTPRAIRAIDAIHRGIGSYFFRDFDADAMPNL